MLQQRRIEILYHKFPEIFREIIPEKYRYFSGKIPEKFRGNFRTHNTSRINSFTNDYTVRIPHARPFCFSYFFVVF